MVGEVGLGCMGMSEGRGPTEEGESIRALHRALDLGVNLFLDTADSYALGENEVTSSAKRSRNAATRYFSPPSLGSSAKMRATEPDA